MPHGLRRFHESGQSHFITFSCYRRQPNFVSPAVYDLFPRCLEDMRRRFDMRVYGYVVMPEHVYLLLSEPEHGTLAEAIHYLKLSFAKRLRSRRLGASGRELVPQVRDLVPQVWDLVSQIRDLVPQVRPSFGLTWVQTNPIHSGKNATMTAT